MIRKHTDLAPNANEPSMVLQNAPAFFEVGGAVVAGLAVANLIAKAIGSQAFLISIETWSFKPMTALATAIGLVWVGRDLRRRLRTSAYGAVLAATGIIADQLGRPAPSAAAIAFSVAGLILLGAIWDELD